MGAAPPLAVALSADLLYIQLLKCVYELRTTTNSCQTYYFLHQPLAKCTNMAEKL